MSEIYSGLAGFGKAKSIIGLVVSIIIFIVCLSIGIYFVVFNSKYKKTTATVVNSICQDVSNNVTCSIRLSYEVNNNPYIQNLTIGGLAKEIQNNEIVEIEYNQDSPESIRQPTNAFKYAGWILIIIAIIVLIVSIVTTVLTFKYKPYAAISGAGSLITGTSALISKLPLKIGSK